MTNFTLITIVVGVCLLYNLAVRWRELRTGNLKVVAFLSGLGFLLGLPQIQEALRPIVGTPPGIWLFPLTVYVLIPGSCASWIGATVASNHFQHGFWVGMIATILANGSLTLEAPLLRFLALPAGEPALAVLGVLCAGFLAGTWIGCIAEITARRTTEQRSTARWRLYALFSGLAPFAVLGFLSRPPLPLYLSAVVSAVLVAGVASHRFQREPGAWVSGSIASLGLASVVLAVFGPRTNRETASVRTGGVAEYVDGILIACLIVVALQSAVQNVRVMGTSSRLFVEASDRVLFDRLGPRFREPRRGVLLEFRWAKERYSKISRLIGLSGETVEFRNGKLFVNRVLTEEPYLPEGYVDEITTPPFQIPEDSYAVLFPQKAGDPQETWLAVPRDSILGEAMIRYWPLSRIAWLR